MWQYVLRRAFKHTLTGGGEKNEMIDLSGYTFGRNFDDQRNSPFDPTACTDAMALPSGPLPIDRTRERRQGRPTAPAIAENVDFAR